MTREKKLMSLELVFLTFWIFTDWSWFLGWAVVNYFVGIVAIVTALGTFYYVERAVVPLASQSVALFWVVANVAWAVSDMAGSRLAILHSVAQIFFLASLVCLATIWWQVIVKDAVAQVRMARIFRVC